MQVVLISINNLADSAIMTTCLINNNKKNPGIIPLPTVANKLEKLENCVRYPLCTQEAKSVQ